MYTLENRGRERKGDRRKWHEPPGSRGEHEQRGRVTNTEEEERWNNATRMPEPLGDLFLLDIFSFPSPFFSSFFFFVLFSFFSVWPGTASNTAKNRGGVGGRVCARPTRAVRTAKRLQRRSPPPSFAFSSEAFSPFSRAPSALHRERGEEKRKREREREREREEKEKEKDRDTKKESELY